jgi:hypothetical protein
MNMSSSSQMTTSDTTSRVENGSQIGDNLALPASGKTSDQIPPAGAAGDEDIVYPEGIVFVLIMASILLSAFLVALVCLQVIIWSSLSSIMYCLRDKSLCGIDLTYSLRTEPSLQQPSPTSRTNSIPSETSAGMEVHTCSPMLLSNFYLEESTSSFLRNGYTSQAFFSLRLDPSYVPPHQIRQH